jgi:hypothetical protein
MWGTRLEFLPHLKSEMWGTRFGGGIKGNYGDSDPLGENDDAWVAGRRRPSQIPHEWLVD